MLQVPLTSPSHTAETILSFDSATVSSRLSYSNTALTTPNFGSPTKTNAKLEPVLQPQEEEPFTETLVEVGTVNSVVSEKRKERLNGLGLSSGMRVKDAASRFEHMNLRQTPSPTPEYRPLPVPRRLPVRPTSPLSAKQNRSITMESVSSDGTVKVPTVVQESMVPGVRCAPSADAFLSPSSAATQATPQADSQTKGSIPSSSIIKERESTTKKMVHRWESQSALPTKPKVQTSFQDARGALSKDYLDEKPLPPPKDKLEPIDIPSRPRHVSRSNVQTPPRTTLPPQSSNSPSHLRTPTRLSRNQPDNLIPSPSNSHFSPTKGSPSSKKQKTSPLRDVLSYLSTKRKAKGKEKEGKKRYGALGISEEQERFGLFIPKDRMGSAEMRHTPDIKPAIRSSPVVYLIPTPCSSISPWDAWLPSWAHLTTDTLSITYCPVFPTPRAGSSSAARRCSETSMRSTRGVPFARIPPPNPETPVDRAFPIQSCMDVRVLKKEELKARGVPSAPDGVGAEVIELIWEDGAKSYIAVEGNESRKSWLTAIRGILPRTPVLPPLTPAGSPFGSVSSPLRHPLPSLQPRESVGTLNDAMVNSFPSVQKFGDQWVAGGLLRISNNDVGQSRRVENSPLRENVSRMFEDAAPLEQDTATDFFSSSRPDVEPNHSRHSSEASKRIMEWQAPVQSEKALSIFAQSRLPQFDKVHSLGVSGQSTVINHSDTMLSFDSEDLNPSRSASQIGHQFDPVPKDEIKKEEALKRLVPERTGEVRLKAMALEAKNLPATPSESAVSRRSSDLTHLAFPKPSVDGVGLAYPTRLSLFSVTYGDDKTSETPHKQNLNTTFTSPSRTMRMALEELPENERLSFTTAPLNLVNKKNTHPTASTDTLVNAPVLEEATVSPQNVPVTPVSRSGTPLGPRNRSTKANGGGSRRPLRPVSASTFGRRTSSSVYTGLESQTTPPLRAVTPAVIAEPSTTKDLAMGAVSSSSPSAMSDKSDDNKGAGLGSLLSFPIAHSPLLGVDENRNLGVTHEVEEVIAPSSATPLSPLGSVNCERTLRLSPRLASRHRSAEDVDNIGRKDIPRPPSRPGSVLDRILALETQNETTPLSRPSSALGIYVDADTERKYPTIALRALGTPLRHHQLSKPSSVQKMDRSVCEEPISGLPYMSPSLVQPSLDCTSTVSPLAPEEGPLPPTPPVDSTQMGIVLDHVKVLLDRTQDLCDPATAPYPKRLQAKLDALHDDLAEMREFMNSKPTEITAISEELPPPALDDLYSDVRRAFDRLENIEDRTTAKTDPKTATYPRVLEERLNSLCDEVAVVREMLEGSAIKDLANLQERAHPAEKSVEQYAQKSMPTKPESILVADRAVPDVLPVSTLPRAITDSNPGLEDQPGPATEETAINLANISEPPAILPTVMFSRVSLPPLSAQKVSITPETTPALGHAPRGSEGPRATPVSVTTSPLSVRRKPPVLEMPHPLGPQNAKQTSDPVAKQQYSDITLPIDTVSRRLPDAPNSSGVPSGAPTMEMPKPFSGRPPAVLTEAHAPNLAAPDIKDIHRKLDILTSLYQNFLNQQKDVSTVAKPRTNGAPSSQGAGIQPEQKVSVAIADVQKPFSPTPATTTAQKTVEEPAGTEKTDIRAPEKGPADKVENDSVVTAEAVKVVGNNESEVANAAKEVAEIMGAKVPLDSENQKSPHQDKKHVSPAQNNDDRSGKGSESTPAKAPTSDPAKSAEFDTPPASAKDHIKLDEAIEMLKDLHDGRADQKKSITDVGKYLTDITAWLDNFVKNSSESLSKIDSNIFSIDTSQTKQIEAVNELKALPALVSEMHAMLVEQKKRNEMDGYMGQRLDALVATMGQAEERNALQTAAAAQTLQTMERDRIEMHQTLRAMNEELKEEISGSKLKFLEQMSTATTLNVSRHIDEFKRLLNAEVNKSMMELGRVREEKRALEQQISDLFALKAKHGAEPRQLPQPPAAAPARP